MYPPHLRTMRHLSVGIEAKREKFQQKNPHEQVPLYLQTPSIEEIIKLRQQPREGETNEQRDKRNHAFSFMVEYGAPKIRGSRSWNHDMCTKTIQETDFTASDETAFITFCKNMWHKWTAPPESDNSTAKGQYTNTGTNKKGCGWSPAGIIEYNKNFEFAQKNRKEPWAQQVETEVMEALRVRHFSMMNADEIRRKRNKSRKRKAIESEEMERPRAMVEIVEV